MFLNSPLHEAPLRVPVEIDMHLVRDPDPELPEDLLAGPVLLFVNHLLQISLRRI